MGTYSEAINKTAEAERRKRVVELAQQLFIHGGDAYSVPYEVIVAADEFLQRADAFKEGGYEQLNALFGDPMSHN